MIDDKNYKDLILSFSNQKKRINPINFADLLDKKILDLPKILVIRFSSIGDIVLTSPVVRCLQLQLGAEVHFLTKQSFASLLEANPYISKVHTIKKEVNEVLEGLKQENFDYIIDLHKNIRSKKVCFRLGVPSFAFDKLNFQKWLLVNFKINKMPSIHIVDRYLDTLKSLGVQNDGKGLDYFIPKNTVIPSIDFDLGKPFIAFAIGAAHATKRMPSDKIISICQKIKTPILLLGGPSDRDEGALIASKSGGHVFNSCGFFSLHQSALAVQKSSYVITHDTGMMHIAAALKKKITSVWGSTVPQFGMTPYYPAGSWELGTLLEVQGLSCRPCSKIGYAKCPKGHFKCMNTIDVSTFK